MTSTTESVVVKKGMRSLIETLGVVDAERFLSIMNRNKKNYDKWRAEYFNKMTPEEYEKALAEFEQTQ